MGPPEDFPFWGDGQTRASTARKTNCSRAPQERQIHAAFVQPRGTARGMDYLIGARPALPVSLPYAHLQLRRLFDLAPVSADSNGFIAGGRRSLILFYLGPAICLCPPNGAMQSRLEEAVDGLQLDEQAFHAESNKRR